MNPQKLFSIIFVFFLLILPKCIMAQSNLSTIIYTKYFTVHCAPDESYLAKLMADTALEELKRVAKDLDYDIKNKEPIPLYVYSNHRDFLNNSGFATKTFVVGSTLSRTQSISVDASGVFAMPEEILAHEIAHAIIFRIIDPYFSSLPLWANEGIANYEANDIASGNGSLITDAAASDTLLPLADIQTAFPEKSTPLAYAQSELLVERIIKLYGKKAPARILHDLAEHGSFDDSMRKITDKTEKQFFYSWQNAINKKYSAAKIFKNILSVISLIMVVLVIIAFFVRQRQKMEAIRRWDQEDYEESLKNTDEDNL